MFLQGSVILFTVGLSQHALQVSRPTSREEVEGSGRRRVSRPTPGDGGVSQHALRQTLLGDGYCCGRFASCLNAFLLLISYYWHNVTNQLICLTHTMKFTPNPEIDNPNLRCTLYTFKQILTLKMWVHSRISVVLPQTSFYCVFQDTKMKFNKDVCNWIKLKSHDQKLSLTKMPNKIKTNYRQGTFNLNMVNSKFHQLEVNLTAV